MIFKINTNPSFGSNISQSTMMHNDEWTKGTPEYLDFLSDLPSEEEEEALDQFRNTDEFYTMEEFFEVAMQEQHVLQSKRITEDEIHMVHELCSGVVVVYHDEMDIYTVAISSGGSDVSDSIELAYRIIDGESPFVATSGIGLHDSKKIVLSYYQNHITPANREMVLTLPRLTTRMKRES